MSNLAAPAVEPPLRPLAALSWSIACQCCGLAAGLALGAVVPHHVALAGHSLAAGLLSWLLRLPRPWRWFNVLLPFGILVAASSSTSAWPIGLLAAMLALIFLPTLWTHVPFYPTSKPM